MTVPDEKRGDEEGQQIPVIDFSPWSNDEDAVRDEDAKTSVSRQIFDAFSTVGFVIVVNHGVPSDVTDRAFESSEKFFALDLETKMKSAYESAESNRGYISMGQEKLDAALPDMKETFDIGYEGEVEYRNRWPDHPSVGGPAEFREAMLEYFDRYDELHLNILRALGRGMGLDDEHFTPLCDGNHQNLRLLHYPPCDRSVIRDGGRKRGGVHTDYGTITLLSQRQIGGLVAQRLDGTWVGVPPVPGGVVVNVGEMLQRWSNDILRATPHQVLDDGPLEQEEDGRGGEKSDIVPERYSIAFFCNANKETSLECLPVCRGPDRPPRYEAVNAHDYITMRLSSTISVVSSPAS